MEETCNLVHTLWGVVAIQAFLKKKLVQLELVPVLNGLTWNLHISVNTCDRDLKLGAHLGGSDLNLNFELEVQV